MSFQLTQGEAKALRWKLLFSFSFGNLAIHFPLVCPYFFHSLSIALSPQNLHSNSGSDKSLYLSCSNSSAWCLPQYGHGRLHSSCEPAKYNNCIFEVASSVGVETLIFLLS